MASAGAIRAGRVFVELMADDALLRKGLARAQASLRSFSASISKVGGVLAGLGGAALTPLIAAAKKFADVGDQVDKIAARTGFAASSLSEYGFAAEQSGANIEIFEKAVAAMGRTFYDAERGLITATEALDAAGLSIKDLQNLNPEQRFELIADRLAAIEDPTRRAGVAMQLLGRNGVKLLPLFANGAEGMRAMREEARELGFSLSNENAASAAVLTDAMNRLKRTIEGSVIQLGAALAPTLSTILDLFSQGVAKVTAFVKANAPMIQTAALVAAGIAGVGAVLLGIGGAAAIAGAALGGIATLLGFIGSAAAVVGGALAAAFAFLASPIGLVLAGITGIAGALATFTETGQQALQYFADLWTGLKERVLETWGGIAAALQAGDLEAAFEVVVAALNLAWVTLTDGILRAWYSVQDTLEAAFDYVAGMVVSVWESVTGSLSDETEAVTGFIADAWKFVGDSFQTVTNFIADNFGHVVETLTGWWETFVEYVISAWRSVSKGIASIAVRIIAYFDDSINVDDALAALDQQYEQQAGPAFERPQSGDGVTLGDGPTLTREEKAAKRLAELDARRAEARERFNKAVANAEAKKQLSEEQKAADGQGGTKSLADAVNGGISELKTTSKGTFSAFAGRALAVNDNVQEEQLAQLNKIANNTKRKPKAVQ